MPLMSTAACTLYYTKIARSRSSADFDDSAPSGVINIYTTMTRLQVLLTLLVVAAALASAQEAISAVETLANTSSSGFVYVPSTTVTGAISVSVCMRPHLLPTNVSLQVSLTHVLDTADRCRQRHITQDCYVLACSERHGHITVSIHTCSLCSEVATHSPAWIWPAICTRW